MIRMPWKPDTARNGGNDDQNALEARYSKERRERRFATTLLLLPLSEAMETTSLPARTTLSVVSIVVPTERRLDRPSTLCVTSVCNSSFSALLEKQQRPGLTKKTRALLC